MLFFLECVLLMKMMAATFLTQGVESQRALVEEVAKAPKGQDRLNLVVWYVDGVNKHEAVNPQVVNDALASAGTESSRHARANWEAYEAGLRAEGLERGRLEERREMLLALLEARFGEVPEVQRAQVLTADGSMLKKWALQVLHADSIEAAIANGEV